MEIIGLVLIVYFFRDFLYSIIDYIVKTINKCYKKIILKYKYKSGELYEYKMMDKLMKIKQEMDRNRVPMDGRYCLLSDSEYKQLQFEYLLIHKKYINRYILNTNPSDIGMIYGINILHLSKKNNITL